MSVSGFSSWRVEKQEGGKWKITARTSEGRKITGDWKKQGVHVEVGQLEAIVNVEQDGARMLQDATLTGTILAKFTRPSSNAASKAQQTVTLNAASADYKGATGVVEVRGGLTLNRQDPGADEKMTATGSSGTITLSDLNAQANGVKSAVLNGPVVMTMTGRRRGDDGKPQAFDLHGSADKLVFNDAARTIVLTGHVKITGDDPSIGGEISGVNSATVKFSATGEVESIDMEGDPGRTIVTDKKKGGGGR
jgi:lipopolysaccharide export system protein LptA